MDMEHYLGQIQDKFLHSDIKGVLILINWALQGLWYSDRTERLFKIILDIALTGFIFFIFMIFINLYLSVVLAFITAHSLNWIFNHHFWALNQELFGIGKNKPKKIEEYAYNLAERAKKHNSVDGVAIYGSFCRNELRDSSDLDIRLLRRKGFFNGIMACSFNTVENIKAFYNRFPLDMHVIDSTQHLKKLRDDEVPIILYDCENVLNNFYKL